jgi:crotonobetainyl-CoA:carnitine CoA-transferase CaiB-like acyl-CoA transferase
MARLPLEDVKILDFMWVMAGPAGTRMLADYGATIVRIESPTRIDTARTLSP